MQRAQISGVGTHIARRLRDFKIRYEEASGCNCYQTMVDMNRAGPEAIRQDLDRWEATVLASAKGWFKEVYEDRGGFMRRVKRFIGEKVAELKVRDLIIYGCEQAEKDIEWLRRQHHASA